MKKITLLGCLILSLVFTAINVQAQTDNNELPTKEKWNLVSLEGTITNIVKETRQVTVIGIEGNLLTVTAGEEVERFDEFAVGDIITFDYYEHIMAEFREPTPEEVAEPLVVLVEGGKAPEGMDPEAVLGAVVKAIVTIEILNRPEMTATVKGPQGNYLTIEMEDEMLIGQLHIGQTVIITYAEAVAMSLVKVSKD